MHEIWQENVVTVLLLQNKYNIPVTINMFLYMLNVISTVDSHLKTSVPNGTPVIRTAKGKMFL
jgi:hypothetical protein